MNLFRRIIGPSVILASKLEAIRQFVESKSNVQDALANDDRDNSRKNGSCEKRMPLSGADSAHYTMLILFFLPFTK